MRFYKVVDSESIVLDSMSESKSLNLDSKLFLDSKSASESHAWLAGHSRI
ncbi:hypothetical protein [uncultured Helicobacter sp.]